MKHTFIEASAGTGKTYTIMELLGDWMESHAKNSENILTKILVLTFTEKAAGELKERLRKKIIDLKAKAFDPAVYSRYLMELDQVTISTIHGFCNMILREYPVETNSSTDWQLGDAKERLKDIFYDLKHTQWKELGISNDVLSAILIGTNFFQNYEELILDTAAKILSGRDYYLQPLDNSAFAFPKDKFLMEMQKMGERVSSFNSWLGEESQQSALVAAGKNNWTVNWSELAYFLANPNDTDLDLLIGKFFKFCNFPFRNKELGLSRFIPNSKYFSTKKDNLTIANEMQERAEIITEQLFVFAKKLFESVGADAFLQKTTLHLVSKVRSQYEESKWMSYDQMIVAVRDAIRDNPNLLSALRTKYQICLLDEFQDTDLLQYEIFKTIFINADDGNHFLYLIGDPKQSIYSFRGGDLGTYLVAKEELGDKTTIPLTTNRRSVKELISGYNRIFGIGNPGSTFFPIHEIGIEGNEIVYTEVKAPDVKEQTVNLIDPFKEGPIHIVKLSENKEASSSSKKSNSKKEPSTVKVEISLEKIDKQVATDRWNDFICYEILKLEKDRFAFERNGIREKIQFRDIAILVKSRKDGLSIESALRANNIPCTYYKQEGIYQSREAEQIQNILECLLDPNDPASYRKLLLGDLFQINPTQLKNFDEHSIDSYEKKRLDAWRKLIQSNQYAEFFRRLEEDTRIFYTQDRKDLKWERRRTNYRQIFQKLLEYQIANQATIEELLQELKDWKMEKPNEEEQPLFDRETEDDAVQILTIHASKGLEWPVVFVHGFSELFSNPKTYDYPIATEQGRKWGLSLWEKNLANYEESALNEQRRLLYVALTRPQIRLYLPYCQLSRDKSPYHKFLFSSLHAIVGNSETAIPKDEFTLRDYSEIKKIKPTSEKSNSKSIMSQEAEGKSFLALPHYHLNTRRRLFLHSYSSLKKGITKETTKLDDNFSVSDFDHELKDIGDLPSSANTGLFLHSLLEEVPFQVFQKTSDKEIISSEIWQLLLNRNMNKYGFLKDQTKIKEYENHSFQLIKNTLRAQIPLQENKYFTLSELNDFERAEEMDFHLLFVDLKLGETLGNFLKGSIDLVIFKNGKYYIADYKSDKLRSYDTESLVTRIKENNYDLQRDIYAYIFYEYLKSLYNEMIALDLFGGVYYLFLRGMREGSSQGVYLDLGTNENGKWNRERFTAIRKTVDNQVLKALDEVKS